jgi:hypothetical protein
VKDGHDGAELPANSFFSRPRRTRLNSGILVPRPNIVLSLLLCLATMMVGWNASAVSLEQPKTRVWDFASASALSIWLDDAASPRSHLEKLPARYDGALGFSHAAEGAVGVFPRTFGGAGLGKQLASEAQLAEMAAGEGSAIAGAGTTKVLRDAPRLAAEYGGNASEWAKMSSSGYTAADGTAFQTHWYESVQTGLRVEPKVTIDTFPWK